MIVVVSLVINEVAVVGLDSGWVEIYNESSTTINLNGYSLVSKNRVLPLSGLMQPGEYKVLYLALSTNSDSVVIKYNGNTVDSYSWTTLPSSGSVGRYPDGYGDFRHFLVPTPGRRNEIPSSLDEQSWGRIKALFGPRR